jgi:rhodanese-related sulfurtransferase
MKKVLVLLLVFFAVFGLAACQKEEATDYTLPEEITMANVDEFLNYPNMEFIDLRNFQDKFRGGYHRDFHFIPFFQYLEAENILVRVNGWTFSPDAIKDEAALRNLFDINKNIVLICAAGARAGFVREALLHLGYVNVWNAGAFGDYNGSEKVFGDGTFTFPPVPAS